jgi:hypothetical protein
MGHKGPVLRSRFIVPRRARTQILSYSILLKFNFQIAERNFPTDTEITMTYMLSIDCKPLAVKQLFK